MEARQNIPPPSPLPPLPPPDPPQEPPPRPFPGAPRSPPQTLPRPPQEHPQTLPKSPSQPLPRSPQTPQEPPQTLPRSPPDPPQEPLQTPPGAPRPSPTPPDPSPGPPSPRAPYTHSFIKSLCVCVCFPVQDDHESGSSSTSRSASESSKTLSKPRRLQQAAPSDPDLPPGYVQSLIRRVINNVNIVVNNLILKYVEDDIVLSVNITCAESYTVHEFWDRAFMDITAPDLVLRKVINFSDCTVCLDKRNGSGKIQFYQDPLLYKCSFRTRLHFTYQNINSKIPAVIKIQTMVESLKLSITDQQLPMFIRIMELVLSLYYGEIGGGGKDGEGEEGSGDREVITTPG
ncbi:vacuolar protein sorting-associated protein 13B [Salmo salar]|uniref:Vacuolar protein sorting-associated protein 13B n=1 Tax=Salmo salar TaxID=8030 RepID=A0ABM3E7Q7_SALSA|nr:vacuolar protein sorting-associated protein 13B-like [Salmo salar]